MSRYWTKKEIELLKKSSKWYKEFKVDKRDLEKLFNRSWDSIRCKALRERINIRRGDMINWEYLKQIQKTIKG